MSDLIITQANVSAYAGATIQQQTTWQQVNTGQVVAQSSANSNWGLAQANTVAMTSGTIGLGIALTSAPGASQPILVFKAGMIACGSSAVVPGKEYLVSNNAGGIAPVTDLGVGAFASFIGYGTNTTTITTPAGGMLASGVAKQ